ncbi:hypothetical protein PC9H_007937 [Pleurotus ostreatus]|uniref:Uncharacterized protein n=1 Tax=Pleurotus ostreatus TaxID=5322 RepID=A0A8H6ZVV2_PLEOS|nr:uncharacterized protein PC9H_007937 [Pleurotus ostreatus]KAF7428708.1 hypothetical protein PC9H_007937 [Pleurotus ostreatus]
MESIHVLGKAISSHPQSIEIIPGDLDIWRAPNSTTPFLLVDGHLGVLQKLLYKLYVTAQTIFYSIRREQRTPTIYSDLVDITAVILLANPAHQTALHERKKLVEARVIRADDELELLGLLQASKSHAKYYGHTEDGS